MKKGYKILALLLASVLVVGCGDEEEKKAEKETSKVTSCELVLGDDTFTSTTKYKVYSEDGAVTKVELQEEVVSDDAEIIDYFNTTVTSSYGALSKAYGGYTYEVNLEDTKLTTDVVVDYTKMDIDAYVQDNPAMEAFLNDDNQLKVDGIISLYKSLGATCE